ncbi:membrane protein [Marmoricola endophyticus]|uniref:Membrane protein n=1 Tax=Marmoricola endophyticus TaxID=2040280 RepID=A0A917F711_9ACTN|nr:permease [Marmoricola endophyticus]GGF54592.1 membrane protein [Marmoricola endophyticus]
MFLLHEIGDALAAAGTMAWRIAWSLILGFALSAVVQAVVRREAIVNALGGTSAASTARATGLGAAASSCSYAAVALARSLFRKGASFGNAMVFQISSTNLVLELGIVMALLLGWRFTLAEFVAGPIMIVLVAVIFRWFVSQKVVDDAHEQADKALAGSMEGHAAMDMSLEEEGSFVQRLFSGKGFTAVSNIFVMEWGAVLRDVVIGILIAGCVEAWVPTTFWQTVFASGDSFWAYVVGPLLAPVVAMLSFVCSVGNVPLAGVLWNSGVSFGGVMAFVFADLLILPILVIYRKYYGTAMMLRILGWFYLTMVVAAYVVEALFGLLGLTPTVRDAKVSAGGLSWNYTTWLDIALGLLAVVLVWRSFRNGGREMLGMMGGSPDDSEHAEHSHH